LFVNIGVNKIFSEKLKFYSKNFKLKKEKKPPLSTPWLRS